MNIKDMVSGGKKVRFTHYVSNELWYVTETGFAFPVTLHDASGATFLAEDKAMLFLKFIRKHVKLIGDAREEV